MTSFVFHWSSLTSAWIFLLFIPLEGDKYKFVLLINHKECGSMASGKCNLCCGRRREVEFTLLPVYQRRYKASSEQIKKSLSDRRFGDWTTVIKFWPKLTYFEMLCFVDRLPCIILQTKPTWCTVFLSKFISFLYICRAPMCPSSGEITIFMRHLVFAILCGWLSGMQDIMKLISFHPA